jgi:hypothetical protein
MPKSTLRETPKTPLMVPTGNAISFASRKANFVRSAWRRRWASLHRVSCWPTRAMISTRPSGRRSTWPSSVRGRKRRRGRRRRSRRFLRACGPALVRAGVRTTPAADEHIEAPDAWWREPLSRLLHLRCDRRRVTVVRRAKGAQALPVAPAPTHPFGPPLRCAHAGRFRRSFDRKSRPRQRDRETRSHRFLAHRPR